MSIYVYVRPPAHPPDAQADGSMSLMGPMGPHGPMWSIWVHMDPNHDIIWVHMDPNGLPGSTLFLAYLLFMHIGTDICFDGVC